MILITEISSIVHSFIEEAKKRNKPAVLMAFGDALDVCKEETRNAVKSLLPKDVIEGVEKRMKDSFNAESGKGRS
jgi:hypothetical protein